jgi:hypothetical protein
MKYAKKRTFNATGKRLLDVIQLSKELGMTDVWIRTLARRGTIPSLRVGYKYWFDKDRVLSALSTRTDLPRHTADNVTYADLEGI